MPDWVKPSFVIFDIRALWRSGLSVTVATVGVKGLMLSNVLRYYILMHLHCLRTVQSRVNVDSVTQPELLALIEVVLAFMWFISLNI